MDRHLEPEEVALLLEGRPHDERLTDHLVRCPECFEEFAGAVRLQAERRGDSAPESEVVAALSRFGKTRIPVPGTPLRSTPFGRPWFRITAAALVAVSLAVWWMVPDGRHSSTPLSPGLQAVVEDFSARAFVLPGGESAADRSASVQRGNGQEARIPELEKLWSQFQAHPADHELGLAVASAYLALGKTGAARNCLEILHRTRPDDPRIRLEEAIIAYQDGNPGHARDLLEGALSLTPGEELVEFNLGYLLVRMGETDPGRRHLAVVARENPDSPIGRRAERELAVLEARDP